MNRRDTITVLLALGATAPLGLQAQQSAKRFRIGVLQVGNEAYLKKTDEGFLAGLRDRDYVVGQNLIVDFRFGSRDQMPAFADELIALKPDVLVGTEVTSVLLKLKTSTIPIVLLSSADPVNAGLVQSLARPGTNVTGMSGSLYALVAKQVELLTEIAPKMSRLALLTSPLPAKDSPYFGRPDIWELATRQAARSKGLTLLVARASDPTSLRTAFSDVRNQRIEGLVIATNAIVIRLSKEISDDLRSLRIPVISGYVGFVEDDGLLSYGVNWIETYRYAAKFVDLILKGAKPVDLPVEQVSKYELMVNQKAARKLGLKIPQSILVRADRVIE